MSLLRIARDRRGALEVVGRSWQENGALSARYWSEAAKEKADSSGIFIIGKGSARSTPTRRSSTAPAKSASSRPIARVATSRPDPTRAPKCTERTAGIYVRAEAEDMNILDGVDDRRRAELLAERLKSWKAITAT